MECAEKRLLLKQFIDSNQEYRSALARCRVCRSCIAESPEERTTCQLDDYLAKFDHAYESVVVHCDQHGC